VVAAETSLGRLGIGCDEETYMHLDPDEKAQDTAGSSRRHSETTQRGV
jgi:hypothetical protein